MYSGGCHHLFIGAEQQHTWRCDVIKTAVLLPAGTQVSPEEILIDDYKNIQQVIGGAFDCVRYVGEDMDGKDIVLAGYVHDEGLLIGMEMNYLATMLFSQIIVGPCVVTYALSPNGEYDGDDYDMPEELVNFMKGDLLSATAVTYNEAALMAYATGKMVEEGILTQEDMDLVSDQLGALQTGEADELDSDAEMIMLMVMTYIEQMESEIQVRLEDAVKDIVKDVMNKEDEDGNE